MAIKKIKNVKKIIKSEGNKVKKAIDDKMKKSLSKHMDKKRRHQAYKENDEKR